MNANSLKRKVYIEFLISQRLLRQKKYDYITPKDEQLLSIVALAYVKKHVYQSPICWKIKIWIHMLLYIKEYKSYGS